jgi:serine phosphatase RsbU (regulator of sigma subunit)/anti-sigma regulatory factor (Ser/Thr protein kinase)
MSAWAHTIKRVVFRGRPAEKAVTATDADAAAAPAVLAVEPDLSQLDIAPNDPVVAYFQSAPGAVDLETLELESPALAELRRAGVKLVVPLVSQGELIGLLNLGPRLSDQAYTGDDRRLLENLAAQAAPAPRVGQLVREQETQAREHERIEQELEVAKLIQQNFLPRELPELRGWHVSAHYRPAREVGGDFYDVIELEGGRIGFVVGDVTDKGVPAAMVMAATRSILRAASQQLDSPAAVLQRANDLLCPDMPPKMFVTCLVAVLDPQTGELRFANAGHNLPCVRTASGSVELRATGMPLGLMPGMQYDEKEAVLEAGDCLLLYSDGLVEAHDPGGEMFGFPRLRELMGRAATSRSPVDGLLAELDRFTGPTWEQEDDITLVALERAPQPVASVTGNGTVLTAFELASVPGNEREAMERVAAAAATLAVPAATMEKLKTAVSEAAMNAIEHGNDSRPELPVSVDVVADDRRLRVRISDLGGARPVGEPDAPDLEAKLEGRQKARGWGLFLIERMTDGIDTWTDGDRHTVELTFRLKGEQGADESV